MWLEKIVSKVLQLPCISFAKLSDFSKFNFSHQNQWTNVCNCYFYICDSDSRFVPMYNKILSTKVAKVLFYIRILRMQIACQTKRFRLNFWCQRLIHCLLWNSDKIFFVCEVWNGRHIWILYSNTALWNMEQQFCITVFFCWEFGLSIALYVTDQVCVWEFTPFEGWRHSNESQCHNAQAPKASLWDHKKCT